MKNKHETGKNKHETVKDKHETVKNKQVYLKKCVNVAEFFSYFYLLNILYVYIFKNNTKEDLFLLL